MAQKSIIIIGAGVAGLAAGCYGQMNGYRTQIFEMGNQPGGLCTGWRRGDYTFDGCIHWLMGTSPRSPFYKIWSELGVTQGRRMIAHEEFVRSTGLDSRELHVYANIDRFEQHLKDLSPADGKVIDELTAALRKWHNLNLSNDKPPELMGALNKAKMAARMAPHMGELKRWTSISVSEFAARFQDPLLQRALPMVFGGGDRSMMVFLMFLAPMAHGDCGVPEGGSAGFSQAIVRRYTGLGGAIHCRARVEEMYVTLARQRLNHPLPGARGGNPGRGWQGGGRPAGGWLGAPRGRSYLCSGRPHHTLPAAPRQTHERAPAPRLRDVADVRFARSGGSEVARDGNPHRIQ